MTYTTRENTQSVSTNSIPEPQRYVYGRYHARILPDGSIDYYREVLTPDQGELIGREYPNADYCWFNVRRAARAAGMTHDEICQAEQAASDLIFNDAYIAAHVADLEGVA